MIDITGGFGIDCYQFASKFKEVTHCELQSDLSEIAQHNFRQLKKTNIKTIHGNGLALLKDSSFDVIYADPSRRHHTKGKVFFLSDCEPNIPQHLQSLFNSAPTLLIKTSPMLDISIGLKELRNVAEIHIIAIKNDVKELLWLLRKDFSGVPIVKTINCKEGADDIFKFQLNTKAKTIYGLPLGYLYEPNAAVMKSGAFDLLSDLFKLQKLSKHSHLYTASNLVDFPGRRFIISEMVPYSKKEVRKKLKTIKKANVTTRNFPENVSDLRKKWNISEGGETYLFFTTLNDEAKVMLVCEKV